MNANSGAVAVTTVRRNHTGDFRLSGRKFYRDKDRALIGGVCAGIADYFGFDLMATRVFAVLAAVFFGPVAILTYLGVVFFVPSRKNRRAELAPEDRAFQRAMRAAPKTTIGDVHRRFQKLDGRLAKLERHVTSPRYRLDEEFRNL